MNLIEGLVLVVVVLLIAAASCSKGYQDGYDNRRNEWCAVRFSQATTAADSLAVVRDTLPRGCKIDMKDAR